MCVNVELQYWELDLLRACVKPMFVTAQLQFITAQLVSDSRH